MANVPETKPVERDTPVRRVRRTVPLFRVPDALPLFHAFRA